jgi:hypothetical protein
VVENAEIATVTLFDAEGDPFASRENDQADASEQKNGDRRDRCEHTR